MEEIKRRQNAIDDILSGRISTSFPHTNIEFTGLQFRKIFELIIFSSLASNRAYLDQALTEINNEWRIKNVIRIIKSTNPEFYPKPIIRAPSSKPGVKDVWLDKKDGFLTQDDLTETYEKLGELLHARSPYRLPLDPLEFESRFDDIRGRIIGLLDNHIVGMPGGKIKLYVGMVSAESGAAHCAIFEKLESN